MQNSNLNKKQFAVIDPSLYSNKSYSITSTRTTSESVTCLPSRLTSPQSTGGVYYIDRYTNGSSSISNDSPNQSSKNNNHNNNSKSSAHVENVDALIYQIEMYKKYLPEEVLTSIIQQELQYKTNTVPSSRQRPYDHGIKSPAIYQQQYLNLMSPKNHSYCSSPASHAYSQSSVHTPNNGTTTFAQNSNSSKYRLLPCRTFISTGTCPYHERCVFLHDPRTQVRDPKYVNVNLQTKVS